MKTIDKFFDVLVKDGMKSNIGSSSSVLLSSEALHRESDKRFPDSCRAPPLSAFCTLANTQRIIPSFAKTYSALITNSLNVRSLAGGTPLAP